MFCPIGLIAMNLDPDIKHIIKHIGNSGKKKFEFKSTVGIPAHM